MGYDQASTYNNTAETVLTKENAARLEIAWQADLGTNVYGAPLQVGDTIYASAATGVTAFNAATGTTKWKSRAGTTGSLAYDGGTLYLHTALGSITALDASSGSQKWSQRANAQGGDGSSSPLVVGDVVLIGGSSGGAEVIGASRYRGYLAALNKSSGAVVWTGYTIPSIGGARGAAIWSSPAADPAGNMAFASTGNNHGAPATDTSDAIVAFNLKTGEMLWKNQRTKNDTWSGSSREPPDADFGANPVLYTANVKGVPTQLVSAGQKSSDVHAFRRDTGELVWTRNLGGGSRDGILGVFVNSTWTGKYMLFACNQNGGASSELFALDGGTGEIAWQRKLDGPVWGRISVANGVGFAGVGGKLEIFDTDTGARIKTIAGKRGTVAGTISIANGRVAYGEGMSWATAKPGSTLTVLSIK